LSLASWRYHCFTPYVLEFKIKHNCEVVLSTFWNKLFEESYPQITFIQPGSNVSDIMAMYKVGWFYDSTKEPVYYQI
jgi:hypothetical protein